MKIRAVRADDAEAICEIWNPVISDSEVTFNSVRKSPADIGQMVADKAAAGHGFLLAEQDGTPLGFATYGQFRAGIGYARTMEHTVVLAPHAQGRGVGRALMAAIEDHARAGGAHTIFAGVSSGNPAGVAFHTALGYRHVVTLQEVGRKFDRWYDLHLMQKQL
jgi:phosphinothricin acetyltransferase